MDILASKSVKQYQSLLAERGIQIGYSEMSFLLNEIRNAVIDEGIEKIDKQFEKDKSQIDRRKYDWMTRNRVRMECQKTLESLKTK